MGQPIAVGVSQTVFSDATHNTEGGPAMTTTTTRKPAQITAGRPANKRAKVKYEALFNAAYYCGLSHVQLARKARIGRSTLVQLLSGDRKTCKVEVAVAIASALSQPPAMLFDVEHLDPLSTPVASCA